MKIKKKLKSIRRHHICIDILNSNFTTKYVNNLKLFYNKNVYNFYFHVIQTTLYVQLF